LSQKIINQAKPSQALLSRLAECKKAGCLAGFLIESLEQSETLLRA